MLFYPQPLTDLFRPENLQPHQLRPQDLPRQPVIMEFDAEPAYTNPAYDGSSEPPPYNSVVDYDKPSLDIYNTKL